MRPKRFVITSMRLVAIVMCAALLCALPCKRASGVDTGSIERGMRRTYLGPQGEDRYSVRFRAAPLRDVLQLLAWLSGLNIVMPDEIEGLVSVDFRNIRVGDALNSVIMANSLDYTLEGNVVRVAEKGTFKDTGENLKTETFRLRFATAGDLTEKVKKLLSENGSVVSDSRTNSLIVRELPANIHNVKNFVDDIDVKDAQVLIEAKILEATRQFSRSLGIQWGINKSTGNTRISGLQSVGLSDSGRTLNVNLPAAGPTSGLGMMFGALGGNNVDVLISAAEDRGDLYIISDPSIVTSNGKAARIRSGTTLLIKTVGDISIGATGGTAATGAGSGLQKIDTGVELKVTPQITVGEHVKLSIEATTSQPDFSRAVEGIPTVIENIAHTTVLVRDGETTVIGGLSRLQDNLQNQRVPFLSRIPLFGNLFKNKTRRRENTELMVFITPHIVRTEGVLPAQARVREIEERESSMELKPIIKTDAELKREKRERRERIRKRRSKEKGNKYVR